LNAGHDPHLSVASEIIHMPYEDCVALKKREDVNDARQLGKVANFGIPGGLGIRSLVLYAKRPPYNMDITEDEARALKANWMKAYPEMVEYFAMIDKYTRENGTDGTAFIEHAFTRRIRGLVPYTVACNTSFQGLIGDAAKNAGYLISRECYKVKGSPLYGSRPVNFIHDQFLLEVPEAHGHEAVMRLAELMVEGALPFLPDVPPTVKQPMLARCWSKDAQQVWSNGRLIPWEFDFIVKKRESRKLVG